MGDRLIDDPLVQSAAIPLAVALIAVLCMARVAGPRVAVAGIPLGLLAGLVAIHGWPSWPPVGSTQKLPWLVIGATALGVAALALGLRRSRALPNAEGSNAKGSSAEGSSAAGSRAPGSRAGGRSASSAIAVASAFVAGTVWLAWPLLRSGRTDAFVALAVLWLLGGGILLLLARSGERGIEAPMMLLVAAGGAAPIALSGASASLAQLAGALAAAVGGFLLCNWPALRHPFAALGPCAVGLPFLYLIAMMALYTDADPLALVLVAGAFLGSEAARRLPFFAEPPRPLVDRLSFLGICAIPVGLAVWVAWLGESAEPLY